MTSRTFVLVLAAAVTLTAAAQRPSKMGFQLSAYLDKALQHGSAAPPEVDLFLQGDAGEVARAVLRHKGRVKNAIPGWVSASLPLTQVRALEAEPAVRTIQFSLSPGRVLNDSMRVKARIDKVQAGLPPLPAAFQGEGVIVGIIDTGMDLTHGDFLDSLGHTRVLQYWDQNFPMDPELTPMPFGYGQVWDSTAINAGECPAVDPASQFGHGTAVAGTAAGNGRATGHYTGAAPKADIILVANDLDHLNWTASVVDAVQFIIDHATALGRPVAINLSLGDYYGSHDGLDPAALMVDHLLLDQPGRVLVCAAGNSGALAPYHLRTEVPEDDTAFTWFRYRPNSILGVSAVYFDLWADTDEFDSVRYSIGADQRSPAYAYRGGIPFRTIQSALGMVVTDTLKSFDGNRLGVVHTYAEQRGGQYHLEVFIPQPDSADAYFYRFSTTGTGRFDAWSSGPLGTSEIIGSVPSEAEFPPIAQYVMPDKNSSVVDSWACSPNVITVGNYNNEQVYTDINGAQQDLGGTEGAISLNSSHGPTRMGLVKPDVAAPGDIVFTAAPANMVQALINGGQAYKVAPDGQHVRSGGTSIAAPSVTGTAALFLEKCPRATNVLVRNAINATAFADVHTGLLPNVQYGNGKLDAFAALNTSNVLVPITGDTTVCEGDSVLLAGPDFAQSYRWNTGAHTRETYTTGGDLVLRVRNSYGCLGVSDTVHVSSYPLPEPVLSLVGSTLESTEGASYQWFLENAPIPGADQQTYEVAENGNYFVNVTDGHGCSANSDTMFVLVTAVGDVAGGQPLTIWPVPADETLFVRADLPGPGATPWSIHDAQGRAIARGQATAGTVVTIPLGGLAEGLYTLRMGRANARFIKH